ncbi:CU044_5270 family protein [Actinomadura sp. WAC 06369]|uniref:CU044_5270 family protein n=1 Tax=Actinomadura sp. WAC 06369 TaxID=2203193 RepID=UPI000F787C1F|nr:CU044_5270 family protein [Actinomadura sp. WAC 06369]RSN64086.1 hypothetical protein DMH08_18520 [Actinomadura sp. WAC 06369]
MDDDLRLLAAALAKPEPSADTVERRRHQLRNTMREPARAPRRRRSRRPLLALGTAAATAAAAVTVIVASDTGPSAPPPSRNGTAVAEMSGPQVLLAAATVAEAQPATSGTYWYVRSAGRSGTANAGTYESWTTADGRRWYRAEGKAVTRLPGRHPIALERAGLELAEIERLPTDPEELKKALLEGASGVPAAEKGDITQETLMLMLLSDLLVELPAPPKVRAAALRALAALPHVENKGKAPGGQSLLFAGDGGGTKLLVDLKNAAVQTEGYADVNGKQESMGVRTTTARWTDEPPR